jgi:hypothetical protein
MANQFFLAGMKYRIGLATTITTEFIGTVRAGVMARWTGELNSATTERPAKVGAACLIRRRVLRDVRHEDMQHLRGVQGRNRLPNARQASRWKPPEKGALQGVRTGEAKAVGQEAGIEGAHEEVPDVQAVFAGIVIPLQRRVPA